MGKLPLISIIVPVYNVENYLNRCVESLIKQTYSNIEVILVDDGSTDHSGSICDSFAAKEERIITLHQENKGNSSARNIGYQYAKGDYFIYVDSDDSLSEQVIEDLVTAAIVTGSDIVLGTMNKQEKATLKCVTISQTDMVKLCIDQNRYRKELDMPDFERYINPGSPCMKLIKSDVCKNEERLFEEDVKTHHEDTLFSMKMYLSTDNIVLVDSHSYWYDTSVPESLTKSFYPDKTKEIKQLLRYMDIQLNRVALSIDEIETLKCDFTTNMVYECWSDYFTSKKNRLSFIANKKELQLLILDDYVKNRLGQKGCLNEYRYYQVLLITLMMKHKFLLLGIVAKLWSLVKG